MFVWESNFKMIIVDEVLKLEVFYIINWLKIRLEFFLFKEFVEEVFFLINEFDDFLEVVF